MISYMQNSINMADQGESWLLRPDRTVRAPQVPTDVEYHRVYAGDKRQIIRGFVAIILLFAGLVLFAQLCLAGATAIDTQVL